jgi:hypothetical protein
VNSTNSNLVVSSSWESSLTRSPSLSSVAPPQLASHPFSLCISQGNQFMIQKLNDRRRSGALAPHKENTSLDVDDPETWGSWYNRRFVPSNRLGFTLWRLSNNLFEPECAVLAIKYANLQLLLLLSRTCEPLFMSSHQDRRPLAPATVARLVIKNEDQTLVDDE